MNKDRIYYVSKKILEQAIGYSEVSCYLQTNNKCEITEISSKVEIISYEMDRHDFAILFKRLIMSNPKFKLNLDFVDYGMSGLDIGEYKILSQDERKEILAEEGVMIYSMSEKEDNDIIFYVVDVLADDIGQQKSLKENVSNVNIELIRNDLKNGKLIALPILKENNQYGDITWNKESQSIMTFHEKYMPNYYSDIASALSENMLVSKDFNLYEIYIMTKEVNEDIQGNTWISLSYNCSLSTIDMLALDNTGLIHVYVLDNFKDINKEQVYESFLKLTKEDVTLDTMLRIIELVEPESTKWLEDYIIDTIKSEKHDRFYDYIPKIIKYVRVSKKSKDRDIDRFLEMMIKYDSYKYDSYIYIDGFVSILKTLNLNDDELTPYIECIIQEDKKNNQAGKNAYKFISRWGTRSFKLLEDYIYEGIKTQDIHESINWRHKTAEDYERRGLNTDYDFVDSYLELLNVKGVDKVSIVKRYIKGIEKYPNKFDKITLLKKIDKVVKYNHTSELIPLLLQCIINYDRYGKYAVSYLPEDTMKDLNIYRHESYYTDDFEPYQEALINIVTEGKKKESDDEWDKITGFDSWE